MALTGLKCSYNITSPPPFWIVDTRQVGSMDSSCCHQILTLAVTRISYGARLQNRKWSHHAPEAACTQSRKSRAPLLYKQVSGIHSLLSHWVSMLLISSSAILRSVSTLPFVPFLHFCCIHVRFLVGIFTLRREFSEQRAWFTNSLVHGSSATLHGANVIICRDTSKCMP